MIIKIVTPQNNSYLTRLYECDQMAYEWTGDSILIGLSRYNSEWNLYEEILRCLNVNKPFDIYIMEDGKTVDHLHRYELETDTNIK